MRWQNRHCSPVRESGSVNWSLRLPGTGCVVDSWQFLALKATTSTQRIDGELVSGIDAERGKLDTEVATQYQKHPGAWPFGARQMGSTSWLPPCAGLTPRLRLNCQNCADGRNLRWSQVLQVVGKKHCQFNLVDRCSDCELTELAVRSSAIS